MELSNRIINQEWLADVNMLVEKNGGKITKCSVINPIQNGNQIWGDGLMVTEVEGYIVEKCIPFTISLYSNFSSMYWSVGDDCQFNGEVDIKEFVTNFMPSFTNAVKQLKGE